MNDEELSALIRQQATRHKAPPRLRAGVAARAALQAAAQPAVRSLASAMSGLRRTAAAATVGLAVGVALTLAISTQVVPLLHTRSIESELVAAHVRALSVGPLIQVASASRHTVKPWFQGKLDYAPPVPDLSLAGYVLLGGRLELRAGRQTAALVYTHKMHMIQVFVAPDAQVLAPRAAAERGFNLLQWSDGAMQVWVVSDAEAKEVARFGIEWRAALTQ